MHLGSPSHVSQIITLCLLGCIVTAPYLQDSIHQPQPVHLVSSTEIVPVSMDLVRASCGQDFTHGASLQERQVIAVLLIWSMRMARIRDFNGLNTCSFSKEQMYSHMPQPTHLFLSQVTCWLTTFKA